MIAEIRRHGEVLRVTSVICLSFFFLGLVQHTYTRAKETRRRTQVKGNRVGVLMCVWTCVRVRQLPGCELQGKQNGIVTSLKTLSCGNLPVFVAEFFGSDMMRQVG